MKPTKYINVFQFSIFQAFLCGLIGIVLGIVYAFGGLIYDLMTIGLNYGSALAFLALIGMPLIAAGSGLVLGLVEAILYNIVVYLFGNINLPSGL